MAVLVVTNRNDLTADWVIVELQSRHAEVIRFNTEDFPHSVGLSWDPSGGAALRLAGHGEVRPGDMQAIWYRRPLPPANFDYGSPKQSWAASEAAEALWGTWQTAETAWVNHPRHNQLADNKLEQLVRAERAGFTIPPTLVTNDPSHLRAFGRSHGYRLICKPMSDGYIDDSNGDHIFWTTRFDLGETDPIDDLGSEPYLFQKRVDKVCDVRVTVIGDAAYAVAIDSQSQEDSGVDWRRGGTSQLRHEVEDLPAAVEELCVSLTHGYGLRFSAIDLAKRPDGGYSFFELNPNGQWAWLESRTGLPLRARLADLLVAGG